MSIQCIPYIHILVQTILTTNEACVLYYTNRIKKPLNNRIDPIRPCKLVHIYVHTFPKSNNNNNGGDVYKLYIHVRKYDVGLSTSELT